MKLIKFGTQGSEQTDWGVELAVVIGETARLVSEDQAMDHVAGFVLHNDYSECACQLERGGWDKMFVLSGINLFLMRGVLIGV